MCLVQQQDSVGQVTIFRWNEVKLHLFLWGCECTEDKARTAHSNKSQFVHAYQYRYPCTGEGSMHASPKRMIITSLLWQTYIMHNLNSNYTVRRKRKLEREEPAAVMCCTSKTISFAMTQQVTPTGLSFWALSAITVKYLNASVKHNIRGQFISDDQGVNAVWPDPLHICPYHVLNTFLVSGSQCQQQCLRWLTSKFKRYNKHLEFSTKN